VKAGERLGLWLELKLRPETSLRTQAMRQVGRDTRPHRAQYLRTILLDILAVAFLVACYLLTWARIGLFLPLHVSQAVLLSLAAVVATIFALIPPIAALVLSVSTDPLDRERMLHRYRDNAFEFVALYSLGTVCWLVLAALLLPEPGVGSITAPSEWLMALFIVLIAGVVWLIVYVYRLISAPAEEKVKWLEREMEDAIKSALTSAVARSLLQENVSRVLHETVDRGTISRVQVAHDVTISQDGVHDSYCPPCLKHGEYLKDLSLRRLEDWLKECQLLTDGTARLATILDRRFYPGHAIAAVRRSGTVEPSHAQVSSLATACQFVRRNPAGRLESSLKYLRDRAWKAAHEGATGEFESILEIFTRLAVCLYSVEQRRPLSRIPHDQLPYLLPATLLRAAAHELGEEVFQVQSPNTVKAWMHFPQRLLQATRDFQHRRVWVLTYPWWHAVKLIRRWRSDPTLTAHRKLLLDCLEMRLHYYVEELSATKKQAATDVQKNNIKQETQWLLRVFGRLLSVLDMPEVPKLDALLRDDRGLQLGKAPWLLCARYMLTDFVARDQNVSDGAASILDKWVLVSKAYSTLTELIGDYDALRADNTEKIEHRAYQIYEQSVHLTWQEQWEVGLGLPPPVIQGDPERDLKSVVLMLALDRDSNEVSVPHRQPNGTLYKRLSELLPPEVDDTAGRFFSKVAPSRGELPHTMRALKGSLQRNPRSGQLTEL
jgi:hypothetical protein